MPLPPQFKKAAKRKLDKKHSMLKEGSAAEEKTESPPFEKKEDAK
jgi:hypothetical protein